MKKLLIILLMINLGGLAMANEFEDFKDNTKNIAQDTNSFTRQAVFDKMIKEAVAKFGEQNIINFAIDYSKNNKDVATLVDDELRSIARNGNRYFHPMNIEQERKELKEISERSGGGFPSWAKYGLIGLVILGAGYFFFKGKK